MQRIDHMVIQDIEEQHAPPSSNVLKLEVIPRGGAGRLKNDIICFTICTQEEDGRSTTLSNLACVCVDGDTLIDAINLMKRANA